MLVMPLIAQGALIGLAAIEGNRWLVELSWTVFDQLPSQVWSFGIDLDGEEMVRLIIMTAIVSMVYEIVRHSIKVAGGR